MVKLKVKDLMKGEVIAIDSGKTVVEAAKLMSEKGLGDLIVFEGEGPVGIITERDIAWKVVAKGLPLTTKVGPTRDQFQQTLYTKELPLTTKVGEVASKPLITIGPDESLLEAISVMKRNGIRRLGVKKGDKLIGVISYADFLNNWHRVSKYLLLEVIS